jgi:hypothetical protein
MDSIVQQASALKLQGGLAGKMCHVLIFVALAMAAICWSVKIAYIAVIALVMIFALTFTVLWRLINLADKSPQSALMEGAEFLLHEQMMIGSKDAPKAALSTENVVVAGTLTLSPDERQAVEKPDSEPPKQLPPNNPSRLGEK